ncbi:hypothetical protein C8R41DRAFT_807838 [Lentinula lateritia]|uniref:Secreted protein n=1 Tax=Lentinula lateritia TaxID=40482 RepID=A0ABQ8VYE8_9AGAR|nr:hypothetical protein C8R41DRAFT_807838 [Lentinula lateritia]
MYHSKLIAMFCQSVNVCVARNVIPLENIVGQRWMNKSNNNPTGIGCTYKMSRLSAKYAVMYLVVSCHSALLSRLFLLAYNCFGHSLPIVRNVMYCWPW